MSENAKTPSLPAEAPPPQPTRIIASTELFGAEKEVIIEHQGMRYRLRITRRKKLILQR